MALTELYVNRELREDFLKNPENFIERWKLSMEEGEALRAIDRVGLRMAAESFSKKRDRAKRRQGPKLISRLARLWSRS